MKKILSSIIITIFTILCITGCKEEKTTEITISAAASLKNSLEEIIQKFEHDNKNIKINVNFGGSGALKNQIIAGAPVDIVFFASQTDLDDLEKKGMIDPKYHGDILKNRLVIAGKRDISTMNDILEDKIAMGTPETVPAGRYAKQALTNADIWDKIEPNIIFTKDVRSAAQYVDLSEVDYAIIYKTDAKVLKNTNIVYIIPEELHKPIVYSYGILKGHNSDTNVKFYNFLSSDEAQKIYKKYNFEIADSKENL